MWNLIHGYEQVNVEFMSCRIICESEFYVMDLKSAMTLKNSAPRLQRIRYRNHDRHPLNHILNSFSTRQSCGAHKDDYDEDCLLGCNTM